NDGTIVGSTFTNSLGSYSVYSNGTNIVLTPQLENPAYFNVSPTSQTITFPDDNNHVSTADFCMTANGVHPDVEVTIVPLQPARPGFDADYNIILKNKGNQVVAGALDFTYNDSVLDLLSSLPSADAQSLGSLSWDYAGLNPFATQIFHVSFNVNSPSETPPVNINDVLDFTASAAVANDETPSDNSFTLHQVVVGSFDPNDKHCLQGDVVPTAQIGDFLYYSINFENTGTFPAQNVVIRDMIDADKFDISSLQVFSASHDDVVNVTGNRLEIFFENIGLEPNEYGYVAFKIKTKNVLSAGSSVSNTANIFFDFNQPVETNTATTTFQNLGLDNHTTNSGVSIFPNPAGNVIYIRSQSQVNSVSITDIQGRVVKQIDHPGNEPSVDTSGLTSGTYFVRLNTDAGIVTQKLIRN
ncbi:MAG: T9SS type A sorting domain-containing protein, partial [Flavobacterium sp.]